MMCGNDTSSFLEWSLVVKGCWLWGGYICDWHLQETGLDFDDELRHLERERVEMCLEHACC
jgi:hypothetical protein